MRILIFQHIAIEHPAIFRDFMAAYGEALNASLGADALAGFNAAVARALPAFNETARKLYDNFMAITRSAAA